MSKQELVADLCAQRDTFLALWDTTSPEEPVSPGTNEGWRIQDVVGHLSFWEQFSLNCIRDTFRNGSPTPLPADALDDDINGRAAEQRRDWSWERVRAEFMNTRDGLIRRIQELDEPDLEFYVPSPWVNDPRFITVETMIREHVLAHGAEHFTHGA